jgi:hypothetical protein
MCSFLAATSVKMICSGLTPCAMATAKARHNMSITTRINDPRNLDIPSNRGIWGTLQNKTDVKHRCNAPHNKRNCPQTQLSIKYLHSVYKTETLVVEPRKAQSRTGPQTSFPCCRETQKPQGTIGNTFQNPAPATLEHAPVQYKHVSCGALTPVQA